MEKGEKGNYKIYVNEQGVTLKVPKIYIKECLKRDKNKPYDCNLEGD